MRRALFTLLLLGTAVSSARGDGIILADGRKLSGRVQEKPDGYEITIEGQTVGFPKSEVKQWFKSPKEVVGDAEKQVEEAKKLYSEAVIMSDEKAAEEKFREALPKVQKAREAYVEARELFPEGYPDLDNQLVNVMKLMRLVRERFHSQIASSDAPVKVKEAPPKPVAPVPKTEATPAPTPDVPSGPAGTLREALALLADPALRGDPARRAQAAQVLHLASETRSALTDIATAGWLFLSKSDVEWGLSSETLVVKGPGGETKYAGHLEKRSEAVSILTLADHREVRVRTASDGKYVTPPGSSEFKAVDVRLVTDQKSEPLEALQGFFKAMDADKLQALDDKETSDAIKTLALRVKDLHAKGQPVEALSLFIAGPSSALIEKDKGKPTPEIEAAFKDLGFEKSEFGAVWGHKEGLAMDDYRKWLTSGEYGMAVVQFNNDYRNLPDVGPHYAMGLLLLFKALSENRNYQRAAAYLDQSASTFASTTVRDHFLALAKSIREDAPCNVCGGTHKVNCSACKGKKKVNLECTKCGGSGKVTSFSGIKSCPACNGAGRYNNVDCPKCKATGKTECKARGCTREVPKPTFESFAEAYKCPACQGRGSLMLHVAFPCADCSGIGLILQPRADPTKLLK
jgi:tetratricopeptide (TPR) repeat protein